MTTEDDQQPATAQGEPAPDSTMSEFAPLAPASGDSHAAAEDGRVVLPGEAVLVDDGPARRATPAAARPQVQMPSSRQPDRTATSVTSAARTAASDRQAKFMRGVCGRLQAELAVSFSRQCKVDVLLLQQACTSCTRSSH